MPQSRFALMFAAVVTAAGLTILVATSLAGRLDLGDYGLGVPMKLALVAVVLLWLWRRR